MQACDHIVRRCLACGTLFEEGVADADHEGTPRCPQCGLSESEVVIPPESAFVIRHGTKFR